MIPNIGPMEIAIVLIIALIVFGPKRLPELGKQLGRGINEFRDGLSNMGGKDEEEVEDDENELDSPAELNPPAVETDQPLPGDEPEVTEHQVAESEDAEAVEGEVVPGSRD